MDSIVTRDNLDLSQDYWYVRGVADELRREGAVAVAQRREVDRLLDRMATQRRG